MSWIDKILQYLPSVKPPYTHLTPKERLKNTIIVIAIYSLLSSIPIFGISQKVSQRFIEFMWIFGSHLGTLATIGVTPVILAGLFLQLMIFSGVLGLDIYSEEGRKKYDSYYKLLAIVFLILQSLSFMLSGNIIPDYNLPIPIWAIYIIIFLQLFMGGLLIILLDDFSLKYGLTSGINLIIFVSISMSIALRIFNPIPLPQYITYGLYFPSGLIPQAILSFINGNFSLAMGYTLVVILTFAVLALVTYLQSIQIEIPLIYINIGGRVMKYPINLLYTSVIPAIFLYGILIWIRGIFERNPNSILYRILTPPNLTINLSQYGLSYLLDPINILHVIVYLSIFILGGILFSYLWVISAGMDAKSIAKQLQSLPIQTLRYRDPRIIESTLEKYINPLSYFSGLLIGLIAAISDIFGIAISGISLLLLVVIAVQIYNDIERNGAIPYVPLVGKYLSKR
ncbi:hypothetical protein BA065_01205 [Nanoarchaeota archaeon NZ13-N]|uniref:Protein translocase subunit SecY n=1 Tax=Candidatus Nanoclepta minutus TaxID=1940235 RepID=A0A397WMW4_9ARCH|nr:MAG: hypothetical protein BA065_01205 [Nanoarchaeota archaeon NZ13-N]RIB35241.1 MAG: hypothetical protein BXU00_02855 [Candidatus Nanoclepta minutus]